MKTSIQQFKNIIGNLQSSRNIYIDNSYSSLISFVEGYGICFRECHGVDVNSAFRNWLRTKFKRDFSSHWSIYILNYVAHKDEKAATEKLFGYWNEFLESYNPEAIIYLWNEKRESMGRTA
ncbi:MAG: hypothetical protein K0S33_3641 [Bacteroidetes bacterium]|jgi:hypothetical protein|nr:hypothetical protein [Bacteroidota bacterium]